MSPSSLSKNLPSLKMEQEEVMNCEKQGIVSILRSGSSEGITSPTTSLRRTLSADMSSRKWLGQNGVVLSPTPMKKIASSEEFSLSLEEGRQYDSSSSSSPEGDDFDTVWSSIQKEKMIKKEKENKGNESFDVWGSILVSQKDSSSKSSDDHQNLPPPYIHPLLKRSASTLSEKSLEVCTESLGSETGSDGFSSYSDSSDNDHEEEHQEEKVPSLSLPPSPSPSPSPSPTLFDDFPVVKFNYADRKKSSSPSSFPPPLPSLSLNGGSDQGSASLKVQSRRDNGRLVLEAVSVPSKNNFHAQRQGGRLVLTFVDSEMAFEKTDEVIKNEEFEEIFPEFEEVFPESGYQNVEEDEEKKELDLEVERDAKERDKLNEREHLVEKLPNLPSGGMVIVHRLALMANKPTHLVNKSPPTKLNESIKSKEANNEPNPNPLAQSLPPRPQPAARLIPKPPVAAARAAAAAAATAGSLNTYEYNWRLANQETSPNKENNKKFIVSKNLVTNVEEQPQPLKDGFLPSLKGCKEPRRSLLFWEPHCIATS